MPSNLKFHLWIPNIFGFKGGIQVYSAFFLQALQSLYPEAEYHVFLMHDKRKDMDASELSFLSTTCFHFAGHYPNKLRSYVYTAQLMGKGIAQMPDLVITTHLNFTALAYQLKRMAGIPYWSIAHGVEAWNIQRQSLKKALHYADKILSVSRYTRNRLFNEQDLEDSQLHLLFNTFDSQRFQKKVKPKHLLQKYGLNQDQPILLTVSRLCSTEIYHGYDQVLASLTLLRQKVPDIHYLIVGKGDDRERIEKLINSLDLKCCVTLAGFVPDQELCDYYNLCDIFAMPSKLEGFGIVYLEAMACGKPVLGGNQDGAVDALCQGQFGALVDPDNVEVIADTLLQILQGSYPNSLMYRPEDLRESVINTFGPEAFQNTLRQLISDSPIGESL